MPETAASLSIPEGARCVECGYSLRGLTSAKCPECGREFDAADERTMRTPGKRRIQLVYAFISFLAGWPAILLALVGTILTLWLAAMPPLRINGGIQRNHYQYAMPYREFTVASRAATLSWAAAACLVYLDLMMRQRRTVRGGRTNGRRWNFLLIGLLVATLALPATDLPMYIAFRLSHTALEKLIDSSTPIAGLGRVGLFPYFQDWHITTQWNCFRSFVESPEWLKAGTVQWSG
jgi:hypothetical protein